MNNAIAELKHSIKETSTIGEILRYAREARGLSQEEAARALCLSLTIIRALENDTCHEIAAPVFIKGYIRNYANLLRIRLGDELIHKNSPSLVQKEVSRTYIKNHVSLFSYLDFFRGFLLKLMNYVIVIILAIFVFIWWHERQHAYENSFSILNVSSQHVPYERLALFAPPRLIAKPMTTADDDVASVTLPTTIQWFLPWWPLLNGE